MTGSWGRAVQSASREPQGGDGERPGAEMGSSEVMGGVTGSQRRGGGAQPAVRAQRYLRPAWGPRAVAAELSRAASPAPGPAHVRASARAPDPAPALSGPASACSAERAGLRRSAAPAPRSPRAPYAASVGQRGAAACARHCAGATGPREACACNVIGRGGAFRKGRRFTIAWGVVLRRGTWLYDNISMVILKGPELYDVAGRRARSFTTGWGRGLKVGAKL